MNLFTEMYLFCSITSNFCELYIKQVYIKLVDIKHIFNVYFKHTLTPTYICILKI